MKKSQLRQIIKEEISKTLKEIQYEDAFNNLKVGDMFYPLFSPSWKNNEGSTFTITSTFTPEFATEIESVELEDSKGNSLVYPHDFSYDGTFFDWFKPLN